MTLREYVNAICNVSDEDYSFDSVITLLQEATYDDNFNKLLEQYSTVKLRSYLRKNRNISKQFADEVKAVYKPEKLTEYITDLCSKTTEDELDDERMQRLCDAFKEYCPNVNKDNAIELAVKQFTEMLSLKKKRISSSVDKTKKRISSDDQKSIIRILANLKSTHDTLEEYAVRALVGTKYQIKELKEYEEFLKLNIELHSFASSYPKISTFEEIYSLSSQIDYTAKYNIEEGKLYIRLDTSTAKYKALLEQLSSSLRLD